MIRPVRIDVFSVEVGLEVAVGQEAADAPASERPIASAERRDHGLSCVAKLVIDDQVLPQPYLLWGEGSGVFPAGALTFPLHSRWQVALASIKAFAAWSSTSSASFRLRGSP
ncbi:hypothetical protein ACQPYK_50575 (plasmid) [Streptosporangium sp. CA-135522]|uniref:hypothetical protein n=1 Tax=Streptosporangium sp. CA-135522 TaxID=3240072 RepID=UPI003D92ACCE